MILLKIDLKKLLVALAVPLAVGGLSALLSNVATERFDSLEKPPLAPPSWVFPVVWTVLFVLMGIASYLVAVEKAEEKQKKAALTVYGIQLAFNFAWTLIFFNAGAYLFAFVWLIILWLLIIATIYLFSKIRFAAGLLLVPYALWVAFAGYLNFSIYLMNR